MGQKTHPLGFRLGITQKHRSSWYAKFEEYPLLLEEDLKIRRSFKRIGRLAGISNIHINRNGLCDKIEVNIETGRPGLLAHDVNFKFIKKYIEKCLIKQDERKQQVTINIIEVKNINSNASLIADFVAQQLEDRVAFRRAIREALQCANEGDLGGIKIEVSGRLNGAEMARSEWIREGQVPLQTLTADIDYATKEANTIYGVLGVKVWLSKITEPQVKDTRSDKTYSYNFISDIPNSDIQN
jgi:small subunit ribosomal protein S3